MRSTVILDDLDDDHDDEDNYKDHHDYDDCNHDVVGGIGDCSGQGAW